MDSGNSVHSPLTVTQKLRAWECGLYSKQKYFNSNHFIEAWARKLTQIHLYEGHDGCVNRLAWNESGTLLASGSDDRCINIWHYPEVGRPYLRIETGHAMNIFGIQFLPNTNNRRLISGAMDHQVILHQLDASAEQINGRETRGAIHSGEGFNCSSWVYKCHRGRVKDVKVEAGSPNMFWSVSEDGTVRQYDTRVPFQQQCEVDSGNVLVQIKRGSAAVELKSMDVNKVRPTEVAVACGDHFVRLYDRRMLQLGRPGADQQVQSVLKLAPLHMILGYRKQGRGSSSVPRSHATYVSFGNKGDKLVATYHGDHAYSFSTLRPQPTAEAEYLSPAECLQREIYYSKARSRQRDNEQERSCSRKKAASSSSGIANGATAPHFMDQSQQQILSEVSQELKRRANGEIFNSNFNQAVRYIEQALQHSPGNRDLQLFLARTLLEREWRGDAVFALHQCDHVLSQEPKLQEALILRIRALVALKLFKVAQQEMQIYDSIYENSAQFVAVRQNQLELIERGLRDQQMSSTWKDRATRRRREQEQQEEQHQQQESQHTDHETEIEQQQDEHAQMQNEPSVSDQEQRSGTGTATAPGSSQGGQQTVEQISVSMMQENDGLEVEFDVNMEDNSNPRRDVTQEEEEEEDQQDTPFVGALVDNDDDMDQDFEGEVGGAYDDLESIEDDMNEESEIDRQLLRMYSNIERNDPDQAGPSHRTHLNSDQQSQVGWWCSNELGQRHIQRYIGHCNIQTDIKEVIFLGSDDELVAAGSDDGQIIIYNSASGIPVKNLKADEDVANCIQCHPYEPVLATSGIENTVKLWSPQLHLKEANARSDDSLLTKIVQDNQDRMKEAPRLLHGLNNHMVALLLDHPDFFERMFHGAQRRASSVGEDVDQLNDQDENQEHTGQQQVACRMN